MVVEELLQLFVGEVDAQLLEAVELIEQRQNSGQFTAFIAVVHNTFAIISYGVLPLSFGF